MSMKYLKYFVVLFFFFSPNFLQAEKVKYVNMLNEKDKLKYQECKRSVYGEFRSYQRAYRSELRKYKSIIRKYWPTVETSTDHKWVEYTNKFRNKKVINFQQRYMLFSVTAINIKDAKRKMLKLLNEIERTTVRSAIKNDILEKMVFKKLKMKSPKSNIQTKLIADALTMWDLEKYRGDIESKKLLRRKYKGKNLYSIKLKLPKKYIIRKAGTYKKIITKYSKRFRIPAELIYAIIHNESSFNPMGRSHALAYGMMQTNPKDTCFDAYKFIHNEHKLLTSFYLYNPKNNIEIGTAYLHVLFYQYLKYIKDRRSRLYCTIAAYDSGPIDVLRVFSKDTDFKVAGKVVNKLTYKQVYKKLRDKLPKYKTRRYLREVNKSISLYQKLIRKINLQ